MQVDIKVNEGNRIDCVSSTTHVEPAADTRNEAAGDFLSLEVIIMAN